jgi:tRNA 2-selenouridine synthase SelU
MANNKDPKAIQDVLTRVYGLLKFTPDEVKGSINDLASIQQVAISTELIKDLTESEVADLNKDFESKSEAERKAAIEVVAKKRSANPEFLARVQAAAKKVLDEHIAYLKTRGDDGQKQEIAKILAEIA